MAGSLLLGELTYDLSQKVPDQKWKTFFPLQRREQNGESAQICIQTPKMFHFHLSCCSGQEEPSLTQVDLVLSCLSPSSSGSSAAEMHSHTCPYVFQLRAESYAAMLARGRQKAQRDGVLLVCNAVNLWDPMAQNAGGAASLHRFRSKWVTHRR